MKGRSKGKRGGTRKWVHVHCDGVHSFGKVFLEQRGEWFTPKAKDKEMD